VDPLSLLWLFFVLASLQPALERRRMAVLRWKWLRRLSRKRSTTVITLIHRQETMSLLGFPLVRYIDIDDAESVLRAIRDVPKGEPIEIILHTPGGLVLAASQIAAALADHDGRVTAVVPHYAMSGGTLIALAADEIVVDAHSVLGPVDPQLGEYPAASIVAAAAQPGQHDDRTLILADVAYKALVQSEHFTRGLLARHMSHDRARRRRAPAGVRALDARPSAARARGRGTRPAGAGRSAEGGARPDAAVPPASRARACGRVRAEFAGAALAGAPWSRAAIDRPTWTGVPGCLH
jgi:membrane-bound ClpP family serine protease